MVRRTIHGLFFGPAWVVVALVLHGCAPVGPNYKKPVVKTPDRWYEEVSRQVALGPEAALQTWWTVFDDPALNDLIARAGDSNLDLEIAVARVHEARARLGMSTGEKQPLVDAGGNASATKLSDDGVLEQIAPPDGFEAQGLFTLGVDAFWEIDVFGRIRRTIEAAGAQYEASIEDYHDVMVMLFAEVALNYVDVRAYQQRLVYARANADAQRSMLELTKDRYENGVSSQLDVAQARYNLASTESVIPTLEIGLNQALNRLAVLLGQDAGSLQSELTTPQPIPSPGESIAIGVPGDVLRQRPDVRRAERQLAAQTALIGVATADLYPRFALAGFFGLGSRSLGNLFDVSSVTWGLGAPIQWNIFSGGRVRSNVKVHEEQTRQALLSYENSVLLAIEEVENAIVAYNQNGVRRNWLEEATEAAQEAVGLVTVQYDAGVTDFNNVLDTQRDLFIQQDSLVASEADVILDLIGLYKALGGGWEFEDAP